MIGFSAPAMAQNNNAVIQEVSKLIKTHGDGEAIKAIFKAVYGNITIRDVKVGE